jgi:hypothetical protein
MTDEQLADELRALGRSAVVPPVADGLATAVLEAVADQPVRRTLAEVVRSRWRALVALLALLVAGAALAPPVRAAVAEWLNIGGVQARPVGAGPSTAPAPPAAGGGLSLEEASRRAAFGPVVPSALGSPKEIAVTNGVVAMSWETSGGGTVRLEQFQGALSPLYVKKYYTSLEFVESIDGYWFNAPHELVLVGKDGVERTERVAGPTLVWLRGGVTFRLEGVPDKDRATEIALSAVR